MAVKPLWLLFKRRFGWAIVSLFFLTLISFLILPRLAQAATGINQTINFQGKVENSDGTNVADGSYDFEFKIYTVSSAGTAVWTETRTGVNQVPVQDGVFRVALGEVTSLPGSINFNTDNIYLGINFNSDGEMDNRVRFTAVPQAFNAMKVAGLTVTDTTGTLTIPDATTITFSGANDLTFTTTGTTAVTLPTSGTLATLAGTETFSNKTIDSTGLTVEDDTWIGLSSSTGRIEFDDQATDEINFLNAMIGIGTTTPQTDLTFSSGSTGISLYNTADMTTNYERATIGWSGDVFRINTGRAGTGSSRSTSIGAGSSFTLSETGTTAFTLKRDMTIFSLLDITSTGLQATSGIQTGLAIDPTINQSGTAGYTMLKINPTISAVGSGNTLLQDWQVGGASKAVMTAEGYLGIGTTAPSAKLNIKSTVNGTNVFRFTPSRGGYDWVMNDYGTVAATAGNSADWAVFSVNLSGAGDTYSRLSFGLDSGNPMIAFGTGSAARDSFIKRASNGAGFAITGNVGIGTTAPVYDLDVNGDIGIASGSDLYIGGIGLGDSGSSSTTSGAYLVGVYPEFAYSSSTNVQDVLDDLDAAIAGVGGGSPSSGAQGAVQFSDGAGAFSSNDSNFFWDNTHNRLGIGTSTPNTTLEVAGTITLANGETIANSTDGRILLDANSAGGFLELGPNIATILRSGSISLNAYDASADSSIIFQNSAVGYNANVSYDGNLFLADGKYIGVSGGPTLTFDSSNSYFEMMNGNVGIGTTAPHTNLHVAGPILAEGGSYTARAAGGDTVSNAGLVLDQGDYIYFSTTNNLRLRTLLGIDSSGNINVGQSDTSYVASINLKAGSAGFIALTPGGGEAMRVLSNGNVGIGTTASNYKLEVVSTSAGAETIPLTLTNFSATNGTSSGLGFISTSANTLTGKITNTRVATNDYRTDFYNYTGSLNRVMSLYGNNVGIGTTVPNHKLDVAGNIGLSVSSYINWGSTDGESGYGIRDSSGTLQFKDSGGAWTAFGTGGSGGSSVWSDLTPPSANLSLDMNAYSSIFTFNSTTGTTNLFNLTDSASNTGTGYLLNLTTASGSTLNPLHVSSAGVEALMVNASGYVGIGTTSPTKKLTISGGSILLDNAQGLYIKDTSGNSIEAFSLDNGDNVVINRQAAVSALDLDTIIIGNTVQFRNGANTSTVYIDTAGLVGIGRDDPSYKLDIVGSLRNSALATLSYSNYSTANPTVQIGDDQYGISSGGSKLYFYSQAALDNGFGFINDTSVEVMTIVGSTGYVGIGDATPSYKLDVAGDARLTGDLYLNGGELVFSGLVTPTVTEEGTVYYDTDTDHLYLMTGDTTWHRLALDMTKYSATGTTIPTGSYIEIAHNQNTNDLTAVGWFYDSVTSLWKKISDLFTTTEHDLDNEFNPDYTKKYKATEVTLAYKENDLGNGADGAITITGSTDINTTNSISGRSCGDAVNYSVSSLTSNTATLTTSPSSSCLTAGDEVLLINLEGAGNTSVNVGNYETLRVASVVGDTITFATNKTKYYGTNSTDDSSIGTSNGTERVMLQRVPNYTNVTVNASANFYPSDWDGSKGGVMFFRATGTVSVAGTGYIHANAKGWRAGVGTGTVHATGGESFCGGNTIATPAGGAYGGGNTAGAGSNNRCGGGGGGGTNASTLYSASAGTASYGGAGGGGGTGYWSAYYGRGGGGGGGGHATFGYGGGSSGGTAGTNGGTLTSGAGGASSYNVSGYGYGGGGGGGGTLTDLANLSNMMFGSAGAAGGYGHNGASGYYGAAGGDGGGIIMIAADVISIAGYVQANGDNGTAAAATTNGAGGGGAGAGGSVKLLGNTLNIGTNLVSAAGGTGGNGSVTTTNKGGNGGEGRIAIYNGLATVTGSTSSPVYNSYSLEYNTSAIYVSEEVNTPDATALNNISWTENLDTYGEVQVQTRSGATEDSTDGSWEAWRPVVTDTNKKVLQTADTHTDWTLTASGDSSDPGALTTWTKYDNTIPSASNTTSTNGRIPIGGTGTGDDAIIQTQSVIQDGSTYKMWYTGYDGTNYYIYYATSSDGLTWTKYNNAVPSVCETGGATCTDGRIGWGGSGDGDSGGVGWPTVIKDGSTYKMWYAGYNGAWRIYYATSTDGLTWTKYNNALSTASDTTGTDGRLPLGSTAGRGDITNVGVHGLSVIKDSGGTYRMWYAGSNAGVYRIFNATSSDGLTWTKTSNVIEAVSDTTGTSGRIPLGNTGKGDDVYTNYNTVIQDGSTYKMWYAGYDGTNYNTYYAYSTDALTWTKYDNTNPSVSDSINTTGRIGLGSSGKGDVLHVTPQSVVNDSGTYKIWYTGNDGTYSMAYLATDQFTDPALSEGDTIRNVDYYEDEDEGTVGNTTKFSSGSAANSYLESTISSTDISSYQYLTLWVYSDIAGQIGKIGFGESAATEQEENISIDEASKWQKIYWDISDITGTDRDAVTKLRLTLTQANVTLRFDNIAAELLLSDYTGSTITSTANNYIQYRAILSTTNTLYRPTMSAVKINYTNPSGTYTIDADSVRTNGDVDYYTSDRVAVTEEALDDTKSYRTETALTSVTQSGDFDVGTGNDGAVTIVGSVDINTTNSISGRSCADGGDAVNYSVSALTSNTATLTTTPSSSCLVEGDEVLLINLAGANNTSINVGNYETLKIESISSNTITFTTSKTKYYGSGATDDSSLGTTNGTERVILQRVPNYTDVTISNSASFYPSDWNGTKGGVMFFRATGTVSVAGSGYILANGRGWRAGAAGGNATGGESFCGDNTTSTPAGGAYGGNYNGDGGTNNRCGGGGGAGAENSILHSPSAGTASYGGGGGGGGRGYWNAYNGMGGGGGGGGHATFGYGGAILTSYGAGYGVNGGTLTSGAGGAAGSYAPSSAYSYGGGGGGGGTLQDPADLSELWFGSAGGAGGYGHYSTGSYPGGGGGDGGGIIMITADTINVSGYIQANGVDGTAAGGSSNYGGGGGGAGSGGSIKLLGNTLNIGNNLVSADGGTGGNGSYTTYNKGGDGGDGRIAIYYKDSYSGTTSTPTAQVADVDSYDYSIFISDEVHTAGAAEYDKIKWTENLNSYGNIEFQTRSGASNNSTDGTWEEWRPVVSGTNYLTLQNMDTHTDWTGVGTTAPSAEGDIVRNANYYEDEDETTVTNITKFNRGTEDSVSYSATISSADISDYDYLTAWVYSGQTGNIITFGFGESDASEQTHSFHIDNTNTWQKVYWDLRDIEDYERDAVTKLAITFGSSSYTVYIDNIEAEKLLSDPDGSTITSTPNEYFQYRAILSSTNEAYNPTLYGVKFDWNNGFKIIQTDANTVRLYNFTGEEVNLKLDVIVFGADLAEWYTVNDQSIEAGDVVATTGTLDEYSVPILKKALRGHDKNILGTISTRAGEELGIEADDRRLLGLTGRVPVNMDPLSPALSDGDYITASPNIAGLGYKASAGDTAIAKAFIDWTPPADNSETQVLAYITDPTVTPIVNFDSLNNWLSEQLNGLGFRATSLYTNSFVLPTKRTVNSLSSDTTDPDQLNLDDIGVPDESITTVLDDGTEVQLSSEVDGEIPVGSIVQINDASASAKVLGVITEDPSLLVGKQLTNEDGESLSYDEMVSGGYTAVAITGEAPAIVSLENGQIKFGDFIGLSSKIGVGAKVNTGAVVGIALESTLDWTASSCTPVSTFSSITWDNSYSDTSCYQLIDGTLIGKIRIFIDNSTLRAEPKLDNPIENLDINQYSFNFDEPLNISLSEASSSAVVATFVGGNVGIGTTAPAYRLQVGEGSNYGYVNDIGAWETASDISIKENVNNLEGVLEKIMTLNPVRYDLISDPVSANGEGRRIGLIAQELEQVFPEFVSTSSTDGLKGIAYGSLSTILIKGIQEQQLLITQQNGNLATLEGDVASQLNQLTGVEDRVKELENQIYILENKIPDSTSSATMGEESNGFWQVLKEVVFKLKVVFLGDAEFTGDTSFKKEVNLEDKTIVGGELFFNKNLGGQIVIPAGEISGMLLFTQPFSQVPLINLTPVGNISTDYVIEEVTEEYFVVRLLKASVKDVKFNWSIMMQSEGEEEPKFEIIPKDFFLTPTPTPTIIIPPEATESGETP